MMNQVLIFDTTLRDGEQAPGASMDRDQKLILAKQLARLKVDVIEAGFPYSSPGDFDAVTEIASTVHGPTIAGNGGNVIFLSSTTRSFSIGTNRYSLDTR